MGEWIKSEVRKPPTNGFYLFTIGSPFTPYVAYWKDGIALVDGEEQRFNYWATLLYIE